jgi:hypothetical protein
MPHGGRGLVGGCIPDPGVEDLDLGVAVVTRVSYACRDRAKVNYSIAEVTATEERVRRQRKDPVAYLVADDPRPRARDVSMQRRVPPHVVGIDDDTDNVRRELQS